jgi:hypothetical protein
MNAANPSAKGAALVVLRQVKEGHWEYLGEYRRRPGVTAKAARSEAIAEASLGTAKRGEVYVAILRSEWRVAHSWSPP